MREDPVSGPRTTYRPPDGGTAARADYPLAPVSRVLDASDEGAELFGVLVAIGGDIPLHYHPVFELQFVLSGTGLALNADGDEIPIAPGGAVLSPAGAAGAHGFRNTGPLPLTLLCVYPAPGGATPGRTAFEPGIDPGTGPRTSYLPPAETRAATSGSGRPIARIMDSSDPGAEMYASLISIDREMALHYHDVYVLHYVIGGTGVTLDIDGGETPIAPGGSVLSPAGMAGAHGFRNTGSLPLQLLVVYASPGGAMPGRHLIEG